MCGNHFHIILVKHFDTIKQYKIFIVAKFKSM